LIHDLWRIRLLIHADSLDPLRRLPVLDTTVERNLGFRPLDTRRSQPIRRTATRTEAVSMTLNWPATTTAGGGWMGRGRKCKEWPMGCRWIEQAESTGGVWHDRRFFTKRLGGCVTVTQWLGGRGLCRKKARPKMDTGMQAWWNEGVQFLVAWAGCGWGDCDRPIFVKRYGSPRNSTASSS
jgi:hypothetical protein